MTSDRKLTVEDFQNMNLPKSYWQSSWEEIKKNKAVEDALGGYLNRIKTGDPVANGNGLFIYGGALTGKSHVSAFIAKLFSRYGHTVEWAHAIDIQDKVMAGEIYDDGDLETSIRNRYRTVDVLVIDDLGSEMAAVNKRNHAIEIIKWRWQWKKATIVNGTFDTEQITDFYGEAFLRRVSVLMLPVNLMIGE